MKIETKKILLVALAFFLSLSTAVPVVTHAQWGQVVGQERSYGHAASGSCLPINDFVDFVCVSLELVELTIAFAASSAFLAFIWGLSKFIFSAGQEEKVAEGKLIMRWGIVGLFFMFTIWGTMQVIALGLGFDFGIPLLPQK